MRNDILNVLNLVISGIPSILVNFRWTLGFAFRF